MTIETAFSAATICIGDSVNLEIVGQDPWWTTYTPKDATNKYFWLAEEKANPATISSANERNTWISPDSTTTYSAYRTFDGCYSDTAIFEVSHYDAISLEMELYVDNTLVDEGFEFISGDSIEIRPKERPWFLIGFEDQDGFDSYTWNSYSTSFKRTEYSVADYVINAQYYNERLTYSYFFEAMDSTRFIVAATSHFGCKATDTVKINVAPDIKIPSGFSPNGDGINDEWIIPYLRFAKEATVTVFNRWGEKVYYADKDYYLKPWDGTNRKGKDMPVGTYYYRIEFNDVKNTAPRIGSVTIIY